MFEKFTVYAKRAIMLAEEESMALGQEFLGTEHLLLGMIGVPQSGASQVLGGHGVTLTRAREQTVEILRDAGVPTSTSTEALASIGIDIEEVRRRMDETFGPGRFRYPRPVYSPRARKMLEQTVQEAVALGQVETIDTEHMLLGMLPDTDSLGVRVLTALGLDTAALRPEILARVAPE
jgi:ATP-dependent Clp protease ATP-binding subunit ClpC